MKFPALPNSGKNPFCPYINRIVCPSSRQSVHQLVTICHKPIETPWKLWGELHGKLPAWKPGKITNHQYIVRYVCCCTSLCW